MSLIEEYKSSLKTVEAEEVFDLLIYRPLAFLFVKITYSINLTPNVVSAIAMLVGVIGGILFGFGRKDYNALGAICYFSCNVLDCADGQIARLKKNGTKVGRIVDGFIDYIVSIAVFVGIGIGMTSLVQSGSLNLIGLKVIGINPVIYVWLIVILAGVSSALQAFYFDFYRNKFLEIVYSKFSSMEDELKDFRNEFETLKNKNEKPFDRFLIKIYLKYSSFQLKLQSNKKESIVNPSSEIYYQKNKLLLRLWSFIGSTTHITLCIVCAFLNNFELFLILCIAPLNLLMIILLTVQKNSDRKLFS